MENFKQNTAKIKSTTKIENPSSNNNGSNQYSMNENIKSKWASDYRNNKATKYYKWSVRLMLILVPLCIAVIVFLCVGFVVEAHPVAWGLNWMVFTGTILLIIWTIFIILTHFILRKIYRNERYSYGYAEMLKSLVPKADKNDGYVKKTDDSKHRDSSL